MIEIQPYKKKYAEQVINLILSIQKGEFNIPINIDDQPDLKDVSEVYQKEKGNFWVALSGSVVVGTIGLIDIGNCEGALRKMFVLKNFRGESPGIASKLLHTLLDWANKEKIQTIYLGTRQEFIAAHRFYNKNNFYEIPKSTLPANFPIMKTDNRFFRYSPIP